MSIYILPVIIVVLIVYGTIKRVNIFECFTEGGKSAAKLIYSIFPFLSAMFICIFLFRESGLAGMLNTALSPVLRLIGIPAELSELLVLRPFSGTGSLAVYEQIIETHGADSYLARSAGVIMGSSETVFYVTAVYFSKIKIKNLGHSIPLSLFLTYLGAILACLICRMI
jgi:spore maturation protein B